MQPTLFYIPNTIAGIPVFGFGLLFFVWMLVGGAILIRMAAKQGWNADTWSFIPFLLLIGAAFAFVLPFLGDPDGRGLPIRGYGLMMLTAVLSGVGLAIYRAKKIGGTADMILSMSFYITLPGIVGARLFHVIEYWNVAYWPVYESHGLGPFVIGLINIAGGGLVVYGGFLGGVAGLLLFIRRYKVPWLLVMDLVAPSMALGVAIGRIGCLLNGCCYGGTCHHDWAIQFPMHGREYVDAAKQYPEPDFAFKMWCLRQSPAYISQVERGQLYGFSLSADSEATPMVQNIEPDSPAAKAGLQQGDRIKAIGPFVVKKTEDAYAAIRSDYYDGKSLELVVQERGRIAIPAAPIAAKSLPVYPTQIFSIIDGLTICFFLLAYRPFQRRDGELFAWLMSIYGVTRILIEMLRTDEAAIGGTGMSIGQNVSILILICAACLWFYISRQEKGLTHLEGLGMRD